MFNVGALNLGIFWTNAINQLHINNLHSNKRKHRYKRIIGIILNFSELSQTNLLILHYQCFSQTIQLIIYEYSKPVLYLSP